MTEVPAEVQALHLKLFERYLNLLMDALSTGEERDIWLCSRIERLLGVNEEQPDIYDRVTTLEAQIAKAGNAFNLVAPEDLTALEEFRDLVATLTEWNRNPLDKAESVQDLHELPGSSSEPSAEAQEQELATDPEQVGAADFMVSRNREVVATVAKDSANIPDGRLPPPSRRVEWERRPAAWVEDLPDPDAIPVVGSARIREQGERKRGGRICDECQTGFASYKHQEHIKRLAALHEAETSHPGPTLPPEWGQVVDRSHDVTSSYADDGSVRSGTPDFEGETVRDADTGEQRPKTVFDAAQPDQCIATLNDDRCIRDPGHDGAHLTGGGKHFGLEFFPAAEPTNPPVETPHNCLCSGEHIHASRLNPWPNDRGAHHEANCPSHAHRQVMRWEDVDGDRIEVGTCVCGFRKEYRREPSMSLRELNEVARAARNGEA